MSKESENSNISEEKKQIILNIIRPILAKQLGVDEEKITLSTKLIEDLGIDSLDTVEVIMTFEEKFNIEVSDEDVDKDRIKTVEGAVVYLAQKIKV